MQRDNRQFEASVREIVLRHLPGSWGIPLQRTGHASAILASGMGLMVRVQSCSIRPVKRLPMKRHHVFWIAGSVMLASGVPALASGLYNGSLAFTLVGLSELICGGALVVAGFVNHRKLVRPRQP